jgi:hypothetical protein
MSLAHFRRYSAHSKPEKLPASTPTTYRHRNDRAEKVFKSCSAITE